MGNPKILIAYFSREGNNYVGGSIVNLPIGNTEVAAQKIRQLTGGALVKIDPVKKYSADYHTCAEEAKEQLHSNERPELTNYLDNIDDYDTIILGYPNYWSTMPMPVWTYLERYDFTGKTIFPFCTHEGSGMGHSETDIMKLCPGAKVEKGLAVRGGSVKNAEKDIENWLRKAELIK
jgi:flavodoxin